jgi:hypothetical protein
MDSRCFALISEVGERGAAELRPRLIERRESGIEDGLSCRARSSSARQPEPRAERRNSLATERS